MRKVVFSRDIVKPISEPYAGLFKMVFPSSEQELHAEMADANAFVTVMGTPVTAELLKHAGPNMKVVGANSAGYDHVDVAACTRAGLAFLNAPKSLAYPTAELTLGLIISTMRRIVQEDQKLRKSLNVAFEFLPEKPISLYGKTAGIVGLGRIGKIVANMLRACGMKIAYHDQNRVTSDVEAALEARYLSFNELLEQSDIVSLHCPYNNENHHMMNREAFARMKPNAFFFNIGRGKLMDEAALIEVLKAGKIAGAGLDVYENESAISPELATFDNVVLSPHVGSGTKETRIGMFRECMDGIIAILDGKRPENLINPEVFS